MTKGLELCVIFGFNNILCVSNQWTVNSPAALSWRQWADHSGFQLTLENIETGFSHHGNQRIL